MAEVKRCNRCHMEKPVSDFSINRAKREGLQGHCRARFKIYWDAYKQKPEEPPPCDDLYVMRFADEGLADYGVKIGRSQSPKTRADQMTASLPLELNVIATFPGCGHMEAEVHRELAEYNYTAKGSREWFHLKPWVATQKVCEY